ncbi:hypothetical protein [Streptomyces sp. SCL15-6]|uniref:hypothetical protein n=1 Tax=Streptomyces sp. SCL15-6 TaxID=2967222 RepID=UPI002966DC2B|nr:hypothetical protein [Streptomyces sp. SCL15-6]
MTWTWWKASVRPGPAGADTHHSHARPRPACAAEPRWDDYRAQLARWTGARVLLHSREGTDMTGAFPEIRSAALA